MTRIKQRMKAIEAALKPEFGGLALLDYDRSTDPPTYRQNHGGPPLSEDELEDFYRRARAENKLVVLVEIPTLTRESQKKETTYE